MPQTLVNTVYFGRLRREQDWRFSIVSGAAKSTGGKTMLFTIFLGPRSLYSAGASIFVPSRNITVDVSNSALSLSKSVLHNFLSFSMN
jgi:hypothetical protein